MALKNRPKSTGRPRRPNRETVEQNREAARGPMDLPFFLLVLLLTAMGLVMLLSASFPSSYYEQNGDGSALFRQQLRFALLGLVVMLGLSWLNYQRLRGVGSILLWASIAMLAAIVIPGSPVGLNINNATRWMVIPVIGQFQPSEIAKIAVIIYFAATISAKREKMQTWRYGIWPYVLILGVIAFLMMKEPHLSGTILIVGTGIVMLIVGGIKGWLIPVGIGGVGLAGTLYVTLVRRGILHYGETRINTWLDPFDPESYQNGSWQIAQCLIAIGSGGLLGVGLGKGRQKFMYLPEEHNDCIFAVICEELGLVGATIVMLVFALLIIRGFWIALHARDRFGTMLVVGFTTITALQTFLNIAVVTGLVPATGISLPFFSYGGTALVCQMAEMGVVLSVSRQIPAPQNG